MQFLFAHGTKSEKTKRTEIGEIPESWEVKQINQFIVKTEQVDPAKYFQDQFIYVDVSSISRDNLCIDSPASISSQKAPGRARKLIYTDDIIFATVRPTLKRIAFVSQDYNKQICSTAFSLRDKGL